MFARKCVHIFLRVCGRMCAYRYMCMCTRRRGRRCVCMEPYLSSMQSECVVFSFVAFLAATKLLTLSYKWHDFREEKKLLNIKYVLIVSTIFI